jgi:hypothetical protein
LEKPRGKNRRRLRMLTTATAAAAIVSQPERLTNRNEVIRAVEQLNDEDGRAFRSRCGHILSAPRRFAAAHVEVCTAASR